MYVKAKRGQVGCWDVTIHKEPLNHKMIIVFVCKFICNFLSNVDVFVCFIRQLYLLIYILKYGTDSPIIWSVF